MWVVYGRWKSGSRKALYTLHLCIRTVWKLLYQNVSQISDWIHSNLVFVSLLLLTINPATPIFLCLFCKHTVVSKCSSWRLGINLFIGGVFTVVWNEYTFAKHKKRHHTLQTAFLPTSENCWRLGVEILILLMTVNVSFCENNVNASF